MRPRSRRLGALSLALLLQVFVLSGFIHPCCLGGHDGGHHAAGSRMEAHGAAADDGVHEGHARTRHAGGPPASGPIQGHDHGGTTPSPQPHPPVSGSDHGDDHPGGGCEGTCGLCCQSAGVTFHPSPPATVAGFELADVAVRPARPGVEVAPVPPDYLLPFANAPPSPAAVVI